MSLTPKEVVQELDKYIIKQEEAKKAVAIGLVTRERRLHLPLEMQNEITPKNILMVGPSGVGKTEIAKRIAQLIDAPFIKVNATQFTEVGYVGRDVDSIIQELVKHSINRIYQRKLKDVEVQAQELASKRLVDYLYKQLAKPSRVKMEKKRAFSRSQVSRLLNSHKLDDAIIEIELSEQWETPINYSGYWDDFSPLEPVSTSPKYRRVSVREARLLLAQEEAKKLVNFEEVSKIGIKEAEEKGIVFIDELDKLCSSHLEAGRDVSGVEVQRDLLPLLEGTTIMTRYGPVNTHHILFLAAGAFTRNKPSDLIPELLGRFPLIVELSPLSQQDLGRILVEPVNSLTKQYQALLATEGVELVFTEDGIGEIARLAEIMNERVENTGARRLYSIMEKVLEEINFNTPEYRGRKVVIDKEYVLSHIGTFEEGINRYIL